MFGARIPLPRGIVVNRGIAMLSFIGEIVMRIFSKR